MTGNQTEHMEEELALRSRLSDSGRLAAWIEHLASRYAIPSNVQFAINLCLEEAVSNSIRHGYGGDANRSVIVRFTMPREKYFVFVVDDEAPHFNPLATPRLSPLTPDQDIRIGGQGLRLLRQFSDALEYEPMPAGNRLKIGFSVVDSSIS
jgi:serine/threonine-protein kinase RsbW